MKIILSLALCILNIHAQDIPNPNRFKDNLMGDNVSIDLFRLWDKKNSIPESPIVFVGSSSIRKWFTSKYFPDISIINRGFGGSHISDVNFYLYDIVLKYNPIGVVLYAGDNDINYGKSSKIVFEDYISFVKQIHSQLPSTEIVFIAIKPSLSRWGLWDEMKESNRLIEEYCNQKKSLHFLDTASPMLDDNGLPKKSLYLDDGLHLNEEGYELWNKILYPVIRSLIAKND